MSSKPYGGLCPRCGGGLGFVERRKESGTGGHHIGVYECGQCGREVLGG